MLVQCENCNHHFQLDPRGDIQGAACPDCGGTRMFREQPSPTQSDGTLRDMVDSDTQKDQGGNPLGEGTIMGRDGELPPSRRDNYMHSHILAALVDPTMRCPKCGHEVMFDPKSEDAFCSHCDWNAMIHRDEPWGQQHFYPAELKELAAQGDRMTPQTMDFGPVHQGKTAELMPPPKDELCPDCGVGRRVHFPDGGSICDICEKVHAPEYRNPYPPVDVTQTPGWRTPSEFGPRKGPNFIQRMFATKTAGPVEELLGTEEPPAPKSSLNWTPGMKGRGIVIGGEPHTWNAFDPNKVWKDGDTGLYHGDYVRSLGVNPNHVDWGTGIEIEPDGSVVAVGNKNAAPYLEADPRLKSVEDKNQFSFQAAMKPSRTRNMDPYYSWMHEAEEIAPKPAHSIVVTPNEALGLHSAHLSPRSALGFLDAHVNGFPIRSGEHYNELFSRHGLHSSPDFGQPVVVSVHDPAHIPAAVEVVQHPNGRSPRMVELAEQMRTGQVPPPPGIDPSSIAPSPRGLSRDETYQDTENPNLEQEEEIQQRQAAVLEALAPLAEGIAGGAEAAGGGAEAAGGLAGGAGPSSLMGAASGLMGKAIGGGKSSHAQPPEPAYQSPLSPLAALIEADYETPASNPDVGVKHDDPEDVDQKEFNDQDKSPENPHNPNLDDSGKSGEDEIKQQRDEESHGFSEGSPAIERMKLLLPLIEHHYHKGDGEGAQDPMLVQLHEMLEAENPGYLTKSDPAMAEAFLQQKKQHPDHVHASVKEAIIPPMQPGGLQQGQQMLDPTAMNVPPPTSQTPPGGNVQGGHCPNCGGVTTADGTCPQCGAKANAMGGATPQDQMMGGASMAPGMQQTFAHEQLLAALIDSANHQGPVTPEQISAVQQWLIENGRVDEVPNVPMDPGNPEYAKILAEIQGNPNVPPSVTPEQQTQPPPPQPAPGAMPVPGMGGEPGGQPMQPMASFLPDFTAADSMAKRCPNCGSGTTGMMNEDAESRCHACGHIWKDPDAVGLKEPLAHVAADSMAKRCPNCGSGTTGMMNEDAESRCHACGHVWKDPDAVGLKGPLASRQASPDHGHDHAQESNPIDLPAAEQDAPLNRGGDEDSSLTWQDTEGNPIQAGQEYTMHNPSYTIPDQIRVERVKPDGLEITLLGTFDNDPNTLQAPTHITKQDMEMQKLSFEPAAQNADGRNNEPPPGGTPGESQVPPSGQTTDEVANSEPLQPHSSVRDDRCPKCGHSEHTSSMISPEATEYNCFRCGHLWVTEEREAGTESRAGLDWVMEDEDAEDLSPRRADMRQAQSRDLSAIAAKDSRLKAIHEHLAAQKTAGKHFTPREQRELIDEDGTARNSDMLDLEGTHYKTRDSFDSKANADRAPDEHLFLGI